MNKNERLDYHQKFKELAALVHRGALTDSERLDLERHLQVCGSCQEAYTEYALISAEGMPFLAAAYGYNREGEEWDSRSVRKKLFARIQGAERPVSPVMRAKVLSMDGAVPRGKIMARLSLGAIAACALVLVGLLGYRMGGHQRVVPDLSLSASSSHGQDLAFEKKAADELIALRKAQLSRLETQVASGQQDITRLRDACTQPRRVLPP